MRTNQLKYRAEQRHDDYEEARANAHERWMNSDELVKKEFSFPDIFEWVGEQNMTAEEEEFEYKRIDG